MGFELNVALLTFHCYSTDLLNQGYLLALLAIIDSDGSITPREALDGPVPQPGYALRQA